MTRVAFWYDRPIEYSGGLNYYRNLLHAISLVGDSEIQPYVFFGKRVDKKIIDGFRPFATVVQTSFIDRGSLGWLLHRSGMKYFDAFPLFTRLMRKHKIDIVSHSESIFGARLPYRVITWIPDFQYLHIPDLWPDLDAGALTDRYRRVIHHSDRVILSSYSALKDFERIARPEDHDRARVLQFVSQPNRSLLAADTPADRARIEEKYGFSGSFFYLPNQFWAHKNHQVVIDAVARLKARGVDVLVLLTGNERDYRLRDTSYIDGLKASVARHGLEHNIRFLGLIDYDDVLFMMRNAVAILNPSRFEGWSSTVEEAKSIGRQVILSDIDVHREQSPPNGRYFRPDDPETLADALADAWERRDVGVDRAAETAAAAALEERTLAFGRQYVSLVRELASVGQGR